MIHFPTRKNSEVLLPFNTSINENTRSHTLQLSISVTHFVIQYPIFPFSGHNARAHMALGARLALRQTARNRLKIGARREGTVSDDILETQRLHRTRG